MHNTFTLLSWDTELFGYKTGRLMAKALSETALSSIVTDLEKEGVILVYLYVDPRDTLSVQSAEKASAFLACERVMYIRAILPVEQGQDAADNIYSYPLTRANERLRDLAFQAGEFSRFRRDPNFRNNEFERLYTLWVEKSITGEIAKDVFVYEEEGQELGFASLGIKEEKGVIGLFGVDGRAQRRCIGKKLMEAVYGRCRELGVKMIQVSTQRMNISGCAFYKACGFSEETTEYIYHLWLGKK